ncbi:MAG: iron-containing alcohol dehydrogenase [Pseudomonadota bacterium]
MQFTFHTPPAIHFGPGLAAHLGNTLGPRLGPRILFITDAGLTRLGLTQPALASLNADLTVFDAVEADPSLTTLENAVAVGRACGATGVIGFGGGSSMDVAKLAALLLGSGEDIAGAWGVGNAQGPRLPLALVPTTAGTGSEVTPVSIITVAGDEKRGVVSPHLLPDIAVLDPSLTLGLPADVTAATGIDAMVHAIEAYTSRGQNANPVSKSLAVAALQKLSGAIEDATLNGTNEAARADMLLGAMLAGQAFANSPVAAVHALAYPIGGIFHVPHGLSNALVLTEVMRFNAPACAAEYAELAPHVIPDTANLGHQARSAALIDGLAALSLRLGLPPRLRDVGIPEEALPRMAADAMKQQRLLVNNPRPVEEADALAIYRAAW